MRTFDSVGSTRLTSPQGEVETIKGVLVRTHRRRPNGHAVYAGLACWSSSVGAFGHVQTIGIEAERLGVKPGGDRERQSLGRFGVGPHSRKAQGVGGTSASSRSRQPYAGEAIAVKSRVIPDRARGANPYRV